jgi:hypothetical protein
MVLQVKVHKLEHRASLVKLKNIESLITHGPTNSRVHEQKHLHQCHAHLGKPPSAENAHCSLETARKSSSRLWTSRRPRKSLGQQCKPSIHLALPHCFNNPINIPDAGVPMDNSTEFRRPTSGRKGQEVRTMLLIAIHTH